jgi:hypothetical protein
VEHWIEISALALGFLGLLGSVVVSFWKIANKVGRVEERVEYMRRNGIQEVKTDVSELRKEFRTFRDFVIEKLT